MESHSPNMDKYWTDSPSHYDRNLNFVALANDGDEDDDFSCSKKKAARDPMSHRIIEKRRRDRMNNCLADLSRLLPAAYLKKGRGRIEKTEIIEMAIKHMRHLQVHACQQVETCEVANSIERQANNIDQQYRLGYSECMSEMMHFLVEVEGFFAGDALCSRLMNHLQIHGEKITRGAVGFQQMNARSSSASSGSSSADYLRNGTSSSGSSAENSKFIPRSGTSSSSNSSSKSLKPQSSSEANLKENTIKNEETDSSCPRLLSHPSSGVDSEDTDRSSFHCTTNPSSTSPSDNNNQDSSDSGAHIQQKDLKDLFLADSGFTSTGASSHSSSTRLDDTSLYKKYKTDIQQRFTAEELQSHEELDDNNDCEVSKRRKIAYKTHSLHEPSKYDFKAPVGGADTSPTPTKPHRFEPRPRPIIQNGTKAHIHERSAFLSHFPEPEPVSSSETSNSSHSTGTGSVPVFVLHPQGSFYVPTLIEASVVTPLLSEHVQSPVLHPITIHVSFGYANKVIAARPEVQPCLAVVPEPVIASTKAGLLTAERRERLSPMEKRKSPQVVNTLLPVLVESPGGGDNTSNNVRRWMEDRVRLDSREYTTHASEELRQPLNIDFEQESHRRMIDGVPLRGQVHTPLPPPSSLDIKEATARSLLELSTHGMKDGYRPNRVGLANETAPTYLFPVQDNVVPVHPSPARECDVLREVPPANSARWSYLMANAKRP